jgi:hypothetical protein
MAAIVCATAAEPYIHAIDHDNIQALAAKMREELIFMGRPAFPQRLQRWVPRSRLGKRAV